MKSSKNTGPYALEDLVMVNSRKVIQRVRMWPEKDDQIRITRALAIPYVLLIIIWVTIPGVFHLLANYNHMIAGGYSMTELLTVSLYLLKFIHFVGNQFVIQQLLVDMQEKWTEASQHGYAEWIELKKNILQRNSRVVNCFLWLIMAMALNYYTYEFIIAFVKYFILEMEIHETPKAFRLTYFFDQTASIVGYTFFLIFTIGLLLTVAYGMAATDSFGISMIDYITTYCKYVHVALKKTDEKYNTIPPDGWTDTVMTNLIKDLSYCVVIHTDAIALIHRLEELLSPLMIVRFMANTFVICFGGLALYIVLEEKELIFLLITCAGTVISELFLYSYFGDKLMDEVMSISTTVYSLNWTNKPMVYKKMILFVMMRAQKPIGLTAAKFYFINMETFSDVMRAAASYIALFQTFYMT